MLPLSGTDDRMSIYRSVLLLKYTCGGMDHYRQLLFDAPSFAF